VPVLGVKTHETASFGTQFNRIGTIKLRLKSDAKYGFGINPLGCGRIFLQSHKKARPT